MTKSNNGRTCSLISAMSDGIVEFQIESTRYIYRVPPVYIKRIIRTKSDFKSLNIVKKVGKLIDKHEVERVDE